MIPGREYSVGTITNLLWHRRVLVLTGLLVGAAIGTATLWGVPDAYRAGATVMVQPQLVPQNFVRSTVSQNLEERLRSMSERVLAPETLGTIVAELGVYGDMPAPEAAQRLRGFLTVNAIRADAFRVTFVHRSPEMTARVAQRIAEAFVEENSRSRSGLAEETDQFMEAQLESTRLRLTEHEEQLEEYRRTYSGQLPSQMSANLQAIQNAQAQLRVTDEAIQQDRDRKLRIEQTIVNLMNTSEREVAAATAPDESAASTTTPVDPFTDQVLQLRGRDALRQLPGVRTTLQTLELQLKPDHPDIVRLRRVIAELERRVVSDLGPNALSLENERPGAVHGQMLEIQRTRSLEQLRAEGAAIDARLRKRESEEAQLEAVIKDYQARVELIPTRETELTTLMRDYDTLRESYLGLLAKKQEAQMAADLERRNAGESFRVVDPARVPTRPFAPDRPRAVLQGALGGLVLCLLFVGWGEFRNEALRTDREVANGLGIPVLAIVPVLVTQRERQRLRFKRVAWALSVSAAVLVAGMYLYLRAAGRL